MTTDTKSAPYFDDYDEDKNFHKILFKPQFPVQARELNQIQTLLSKQVERLGNRVLKQGTVVSGCQTTSSPKLAYVKVKNNETDGSVADVSRFEGAFARNSSNTVAKVITTERGFTDQAPDLNTLFLRYINSGDDGQTFTYAADEVLTLYNGNSPIETVNIVDGSNGFSAEDAVTFIPAARIANTAGGNVFSSGINVGDTVTDAGGANLVIASIDNENDSVFVTFTPQIADQLAGNTAAWGVEADSTFVNSDTTQTFVIEEVFGQDAAGTVNVNAIGEITKINLVNNGTGYDRLPTPVVISSSATSSQLQSLDLAPKNYIGQVAVAGAGYNPIGTGFGIAIDGGLVYIGGYIVRSSPQFVVVEKYNSEPSEKAVGFEAVEEVVTAQTDSSLYDNALGAANHTAPGADRLKITAKAVTVDAAEAKARDDFLPLVEFSEGQPFQVSEQTESSLIDDHLAVRTFEESGNFVVDPFILTTKSANVASSDTDFKVVVDPGVAYIDGYRVATQRNYAQTVAKATDTKTITQTVSSTGYGSYILASSIKGLPSFGAPLPLFNGADNIGSARCRGVKSVGEGTGRKFRVYLYDIQMNSGRSFKDVTYINTGNFSVVPERYSGQTILVSPNNSRAIFNAPVKAIKSVDSVSYVYQKANWGAVTANTSGFVTLTTSDPTEGFPISGQLDDDDLKQVLLSTDADAVAATAFGGTIDTVAANNEVVGVGTTFTVDVAAGQFIEVANTTASEIVQVESIANNTMLTTVAAPTITLSEGEVSRAFKLGEMIIPESVVVSGDSQTMTIDLGADIPTTAMNVVAPVRKTPTVSSMSVTRNAVARLNLATHNQGVEGPWALGHSNIIRLRGVYKGSNTTFTAAEGIDVTAGFYIDSNDTTDSKGTGYLYRKNTSSVTLNSSERLLVVFDVVSQSSGSVITVNSYPIDDTVALGDSASTVNTLELPEIFGETYYDVRDAFDFRPAYANTVALQTTQASAPINPTEPAYNDRYASLSNVPAPDSEITSTITYYLPRQDRVIASFNGDIKVLKGQSGTDKLPQEPEKAITINTLNIPAYPSIAANLSDEMAEIADMKVANENLAGRRLSRYTINTTLTDSAISDEQPRRYTQRQIGALDRRIDAVEYFLALTAAESQASARHIGSSTGNTNRFKFGFLVDSFVDSSRSQTDHPSYSASLDNGFVTSKFDKLSIKLSDAVDTGSNGLVSLPYSSQQLTGQFLATDGPVVPPVPEPVNPDEPDVVVNPDPAPTPPAIQQRICSRQVTSQNTLVDANGKATEEANFRFSSLPGTAEMAYGFNYNDFSINVFQGTTPNFSIIGKTPIKTVLAALPLDESDRGRFEGITDYNYPEESITYVNGMPSIWGSGKITWEHNPENGIYYIIQIVKLRQHPSAIGTIWKGHFSYFLYYPCDSTSVSEEEVFNGVTAFEGTMTIDPTAFVIDYNRTEVLKAFFPPQAFRVNVTGLKPLTLHNVLMEGEDYNTRVRPVGGALGASVKSDAEGKASFDLFFNYNGPKGGTISAKEVTVRSGDLTSSAAAVIQPPKYTIASRGGHKESSYANDTTHLQQY